MWYIEYLNVFTGTSHGSTKHTWLEFAVVIFHCLFIYIIVFLMFLVIHFDVVFHYLEFGLFPHFSKKNFLLFSKLPLFIPSVVIYHFIVVSLLSLCALLFIVLVHSIWCLCFITFNDRFIPLLPFAVILSALFFCTTIPRPPQVGNA